MTWAVLGSIEFELVNHPSQQSERTTADYAEHERMQGKPLLQWIGDGLDELSLEIALHAALVDPEEQIRRLKVAKSAHQPLPYVLGSGDYRGIYLITSLDVTTRKTTDTGRLVAAVVNLVLREYTGKYSKPLPVPRGLRNTLQANPQARVGGNTLPMATPTQRALGMAKTAGNLLRVGLDAYRVAKNVNDPVALLGQAPRLISMTGQVLAPLEGMHAAAKLMQNGADLVQLGVDAATEVRLAQGALDPPNPEAILNQVSYAASRFEQAMARMNSAAPLLARMAADVVTRRA